MELIQSVDPLIGVGFTAHSEDFASRAFLEQYQRSATTAWEKGERAGLGSIRKDSGFLITIQEGLSISEMMVDIEIFLSNNEKMIADLRQRNVSARLDVFLGVGGNIAFARSVVYPPSLLHRLAEMHVGIETTVYPYAGDQ